MTNPQRVFVVGTGYVGLTTGVALALLGRHVTCMDIDVEKIVRLQRGASPIHEPHVEGLLRQAGLSFTTSLDEVGTAEVILICVGTPPLANGQADLSHVEATTLSVAAQLLPGRQYTVVVKSTVPVGTSHRVAFLTQKALAQRAVEAEVHIASNPEFLREGAALYDTFYPDRIVVGTTSEAASAKLWELYRPLLEQSFAPPSELPRPDGFLPPQYVVVDPNSSELIKYASNAFLATKVSFINEIAGLCERVGAEVREVARGMGLDKRIGRGFLNAGVGWGGSCFGKDTLALLKTANDHGYTMPLLEAARAVNARQRQWVVAQLQEVLNTLRGRTVGLLGLAFKPDTDDVRDAPSLDIVQQLLIRGAHVQAHDPVAGPNAQRALPEADVQYCQAAEGVFQNAHAVVLLTEWKAYRDLPFVRLKPVMQTPLIIDGRNHLDHPALRDLGFKVMGVGNPCGSW